VSSSVTCCSSTTTTTQRAQRAQRAQLEQLPLQCGFGHPLLESFRWSNGHPHKEQPFTAEAVCTDLGLCV